MTQLTIGELIKKLEEVKKEHGDLKVMYEANYCEYAKVHGTTVMKVVDEWDQKKVEKIVVIGQ